MENFSNHVSRNSKKAPAWEFGLYLALCIVTGTAAWILYMKTPQRPKLDEVEVAQPRQTTPAKNQTESLRDRLR